MSILISIIAMVCLGLTHFINGMLSRHYDVNKISLFTHIGGFLIALMAALFYANFTLSALYWGALSGIASAWGAIFLYRGMSTSAVSVTVPLSGVSMVFFSLIISILFLGERIGLLSSLGVVCSIPAIVLMTWNTNNSYVNEKKRSGINQAILSGLGFACQLVTLGKVPSSGALAAVAASMFVGATAILFYAKPSIFEVARNRARIAMFAGAISTLGLVLYTIAKESQLVIVGVLIVSMYPLVPVILGVIHLKEKISGIRALGIFLSVSSIFILTLGSSGNVKSSDMDRKETSLLHICFKKEGNVFPSQVEAVLCNFPDLSPYYLLEFERHGFTDNIILNVELKRGKDNLERSHIYDISESLKRDLNNELGVCMKVRMYSSGVLEKCESKRKVVNKRLKNADSSYIA